MRELAYIQGLQHFDVGSGHIASLQVILVSQAMPVLKSLMSTVLTIRLVTLTLWFRVTPLCNKVRAKAYCNRQYVLVTGSKVLSITDDHITVDYDGFNFDSAVVYFTSIEQIFNLSQGQHIEFEGYCEYDEFWEEFKFTDCALVY